MIKFLKINFSFLIAAIILGSVFSIWPLPTRAQYGSNCDPTISVKRTGATSGTQSIIIKPADAANLSVDVKFSGGFGGSTQSDCTGTAAIKYLWKNTSDNIEINRNKTYGVTVPSTEGVYKMELQLYDQRGNTYLQRQVAVTVAKDIMNPPGGGGDPGGGDPGGGGSGGTGGNTNPPPNPGLNNNAINTGVGVNFNVNMDSVIGRFFNPLNVESLPELIVKLLNILFTLIGIAAVIVIIIAGFRMVVDSGNETQLKKAKEAITWAVIGLIVSILAFSIVAIIQKVIQG